jgi:hypothetical protein
MKRKWKGKKQPGIDPNPRIENRNETVITDSTHTQERSIAE